MANDQSPPKANPSLTRASTYYPLERHQFFPISVPTHIHRYGAKRCNQNQHTHRDPVDRQYQNVDAIQPKHARSICVVAPLRTCILTEIEVLLGNYNQRSVTCLLIILRPSKVLDGKDAAGIGQLRLAFHRLSSNHKH